MWTVGESRRQIGQKENIHLYIRYKLQLYSKLSLHYKSAPDTSSTTTTSSSWKWGCPVSLICDLMTMQLYSSPSLYGLFSPQGKYCRIQLLIMRIWNPTSPQSPCQCPKWSMSPPLPHPCPRPRPAASWTHPLEAPRSPRPACWRTGRGSRWSPQSLFGWWRWWGSQSASCRHGATRRRRVSGEPWSIPGLSRRKCPSPHPASRRRICSRVTSGSRAPCPSGWCLPSGMTWIIIFSYESQAPSWANNKKSPLRIVRWPAGGYIHHLLHAQLSAEHLGVCHRPVHWHVLNLLLSVEAAQCQDACLKCYMNCTATVKKRVCLPQLEFWPCTWWYLPRICLQEDGHFQPIWISPWFCS